jgi:hypothetical protein
MIAPATFFMSGPLGPFLSRMSSSSITHLLYAWVIVSSALVSTEAAEAEAAAEANFL